MLKSVKILFRYCTFGKIDISLHHQLTIKNNNNDKHKINRKRYNDSKISIFS